MSILLTRYSEPVLVLFSDYSRHKVHLLRFYSRILGDFTRDDSQRPVLAQHRVAIWNSVATI